MFQWDLHNGCFDALLQLYCYGLVVQPPPPPGGELSPSTPMSPRPFVLPWEVGGTVIWSTPKFCCGSLCSLEASCVVGH